MKSTSTGSSMARHRSLMNSHGALQHPDQQRRVVGVVGGDLGPELGHPGGDGLGATSTGPTAGSAQVGRPRRASSVSTGATLPDAARPLRPGQAAGRRGGPAAPRPPRWPRAPPAGHGQDPVHLGQRRRVVARRRPAVPGVGGEPAPDAPGGPAGPAPRPGPGVGGVGTAAAASASSSAASSPATPAWRARSGTGSRPASAAHSGSSSWRTRLRTVAGVGVGGVVHRRRARPPRTRRGSRRGAGRAAGGAAPGPWRPARRGRRPAAG